MSGILAPAIPRRTNTASAASRMRVLVSAAVCPDGLTMRSRTHRRTISVPDVVFVFPQVLEDWRSPRPRPTVDDPRYFGGRDDNSRRKNTRNRESFCI